MDRDPFTSLSLRASLAHNVVGVIEVGFKVLEHGVKVLNLGPKFSSKRRGEIGPQTKSRRQLT
jgi:hypothetical protein